MLSDTQAAWVAALIDGEGCISIWKERRKGNKSGFRYCGAMCIVNTNRHLLETVAKVLPGVVYLKDKRQNNPRHKPLFSLHVLARNVGPVLRAVAPFLVIKRRQAELLMRFREVTENAPMRASQDHEILDVLYLECRALNKRGVEA